MYVMTHINKMVTISLEQEQFLKETGFKPSKLLQQAINSLMESTNEGDLKELIRSKQSKINFLLETVNKQRDFIERNNLITEYMK